MYKMIVKNIKNIYIIDLKILCHLQTSFNKKWMIKIIQNHHLIKYRGCQWTVAIRLLWNQDIVIFSQTTTVLVVNQTSQMLVAKLSSG